MHRLKELVEDLVELLRRLGRGEIELEEVSKISSDTSQRYKRESDLIAELWSILADEVFVGDDGGPFGRGSLVGCAHARDGDDSVGEVIHESPGYHSSPEVLLAALQTTGHEDKPVVADQIGRASCRERVS